MKIACYQLKKDNSIKSIPWEGLTTTQQKLEPDDDLWVEADVSSITEIETPLRQQNVHPLILEDCLNPEHSTLVDRYPEAVYIELPTNAGPKHGGMAYLSIICMPSLIVTIRRGEIPKLPRLITILQEEEHLELGNTGNLLYKLIDYFIERTVNQSLRYRQQTNRLEKLLNEEPEEIDPNELANLRQHLTQLEFICSDQKYCANSLVSRRHSVIEMVGQEAYFNDLVTDSEHALRAINRLNGRLKDLQNNLELQHRYSLEKRIRLLTILSAVFFPLTFITGFFGMNFTNMGILEWQYGIVFFTFLLLIIPLIMLWFFHSHGWFD